MALQFEHVASNTASYLFLTPIYGTGALDAPIGEVEIYGPGSIGYFQEPIEIQVNFKNRSTDAISDVPV